MPIHDDAQSVLEAVYQLEQEGSRMPNASTVADRLGINRSTIDRPVAWLKDRGFIDGVAAYGGALLLIKTTTKGQDTIEYGRHVRDSEDPQLQPAVAINNTTTSGSINQQVGNNNEQSIRIGITPNDVAKLMRELAAGGRQDLADEVDAATAGGRNPGGIGRVLAAIIPALSSTAELGSAAATIGGWFA